MMYGRAHDSVSRYLNCLSNLPLRRHALTLGDAREGAFKMRVEGFGVDEVDAEGFWRRRIIPAAMATFIVWYFCQTNSFGLFSNRWMLFCHVRQQRRRNGLAAAGPYLFLSAAGTGCTSRRRCRHASALKREGGDLYSLPSVFVYSERTIRCITCCLTLHPWGVMESCHGQSRGKGARGGRFPGPPTRKRIVGGSGL